MVKNYDLQDFQHLLEVCRECLMTVDKDARLLSSGIEYAIEAFSSNPEMYIAAVKAYIDADTPYDIRSGNIILHLFSTMPAENVKEMNMLRLMDSPKMKGLLNTVSMPNWYHCIDEALRKSDMTRADIDYLDILHIKRSGHKAMLADLGLTEDQSIYLEDYGHIGQIDQILSLELALQQGKVKEGSTVCMIAAGIGYTWAANIIKWG